MLNKTTNKTFYFERALRGKFGFEVDKLATFEISKVANFESL